MKLMLKVIVALAVFMTAVIAYAEVPDVSKWSCPGGVIESHPNYGIEITECNGNGSLYVKISNKLIYIHEHRMDAGKAVYYNALKNDEGNWVEIVNKNKDVMINFRGVENRGVEANIIDDNDNVVAKRLIPRLKK